MATLSGQTTVAAAGTEVVLGTGLINGPLMVKALTTNGGLVYVGNVDGAVSSALGMPMAAGDVVIYNQVGESPVGNRGMMAVPYFQGANGPYWDLNARGVVFGLHTEYGRPHLLRALMEGLAYESRRQAELMEEGTGTKVEQIKMYGGYVKWFAEAGMLWCRLFSSAADAMMTVPFL